ncbi:hypothetical protein [Streptomyces sp. H39-C1]|uniref:hypothetical protein n=1 Tax=Streptomyces sp. H39-C1 TaxID=3004355 RepID=UPI0022AEF0ED|nr:hypothetical protein [Streptomyces sp. H39-C1]MCZ4102351.1 hypothetical protein [Streptomyces sp. H39-C1]
MPSHHLPLLLTAYQHRFRRKLEAMSHHLIDTVAIGWDELGTDLLDGAPLSLIAGLTGGAQWPSRALAHVITPDGSPPVRMTVTDDTADAQGMQWGYVLHEQGIEVISLYHQDLGPIVKWSTDPRTLFSDDRELWFCDEPAPIIRSVQNTPPLGPPTSAPAKTGIQRPATRR